MPDVLHTSLTALHGALAVAVILGVARTGRSVARRLGQPEVIGEVAAGLLAGPAVAVVFGRAALDVVLPPDVSHGVELLSEIGLALFLVGVVHHMRREGARVAGGAVGRVSLGALVPPLLCGAGLGAIVVTTGDPAVRGSAPLPAFVLMTGVATAITAVPVLARILDSRGMRATPLGVVSTTAAIVVDAVGWLLLTVAICLARGSTAGLPGVAVALALGLGTALTTRLVLRTGAATRFGERAPQVAAGLLGAVALAVALAMEDLGLTLVLGAALAGVAVPGDRDGPWGRVVGLVTRVGRALVPTFFVITGITVFLGAFGATPWWLLAPALALAVAGKAGGAYAGARAGRMHPRSAARVAVLMNTRGLTELVVLQAGLAAGVLTPPLVAILVVVAVVTTAATGPLLAVLDRRAPLPDEPRPATATEQH